jgi:D-alanyl-D-alanine dipeptidase
MQKLHVVRKFAVAVAASCIAGLAVSAAQQPQGPPKDPGATRAADLVELVTLDPTIKLDIRYAGTNNFIGKPVYQESRAFLQRPAAEALLAAHRELAQHRYGLLIHDHEVVLGDHAAKPA